MIRTVMTAVVLGACICSCAIGASGDELSELLASDGTTGDHFGNSIAVSGNTAVVGADADDENGSQSGSAYVFDVRVCDGDVDGDNIVDVNDISAVLFRLGLMPGDFGYQASADANSDGAIDVNDISYVLFRLGESCG